MSGCCGEYRCRRSQQVRLVRGGLSGVIYVVTRWREYTNGAIESIEKHRIHPVDEATLNEVYRKAALWDEHEASDRAPL